MGRYWKGGFWDPLYSWLSRRKLASATPVREFRTLEEGEGCRGLGGGGVERGGRSEGAGGGGRGGGGIPGGESLGLILGIYESAKTGREVPLPLRGKI